MFLNLTSFEKPVMVNVDLITTIQPKYLDNKEFTEITMADSGQIIVNQSISYITNLLTHLIIRV